MRHLFPCQIGPQAVSRHTRLAALLARASLVIAFALTLSGCVPEGFTPAIIGTPLGPATPGNSPAPAGTETPHLNASPEITVTPGPTQQSPGGATPGVTRTPAGAVQATLVKVIDGDTIDVSIDGRTERVRYVGVDTPERTQPGFKSATEANRRLLGNGPLYLVRDVSDRDKTSTHRLLRYVYTANGALVGDALVAQGWAQPVEYPPDTKFAEYFRKLAVVAARKKVGFWSATPPPDGAMPYGLTTRTAEVRKGPGTNFAATSSVEKDTPLTIYGRTPAGDWLQVRTPTRDGGWMDARSVRLNVPVSEVPVPEKIPTTP